MRILRAASALLVTSLAFDLAAAQQPQNLIIVRDPCSAVLRSPVGVAALDAVRAKSPRQITPSLITAGDQAFGPPALCGKDAQGKDKTACAVTAAEIDQQRKMVANVDTSSRMLADPVQRTAYACAVNRIGQELDARALLLKK